MKNMERQTFSGFEAIVRVDSIELWLYEKHAFKKQNKKLQQQQKF